jgi:hypothetical protein
MEEIRKEGKNKKPSKGKYQDGSCPMKVHCIGSHAAYGAT